MCALAAGFLQGILWLAAGFLRLLRLPGCGDTRGMRNTRGMRAAGGDGSDGIDSGDGQYPGISWDILGYLENKAQHG